MSLKHNLKTYPKKKPLPRNVIDCNRLHREKDLWHEKLVEELEQLKQIELEFYEKSKTAAKGISTMTIQWIDEILGKTQ